MRLVIQRVARASVTKVETGKVLGAINKGFFVLLGVGKEDSVEKAGLLAEKVAKMRLMVDEEEKMNLEAKEFLVVSQFTLYADTAKGNRPSFIKAGDPAKSKEIYEHFISELKTKGIKVETGGFGDYMQIDTLLDGPVTIILEN